MQDMLNNFMKNASNYTKNPLGIIALFISLIYGFACLVLSFTNTGLDKIQKWALIWFIIVFPVIVLGTFVYLVVNHHRKLYGPGDFREDSSFLRTLDIEEQRERILESVDSNIDSEIKENKNEFVNESTKQDMNNAEPSASKSSLEVRKSAIQIHMLAEELVMRQLESEYNTTIKRQVALNYDKTSSLSIDGIIMDKTFTGIEVKYIKSKYISPHTASSIQLNVKKFAEITNKYRFKNSSFIVVIVTDEQEEVLIEPLNRRLKGVDIKTEIRVFKLKELKEKFGI